MKYLLDCNVLSEPSRRAPNPSLMARMSANTLVSCTAAPVIHEMRYGLARLPISKRRTELEDYFFRLLHQPIKILPYDGKDALWHGECRAKLENQGQTPPLMDSMIASIAVVNGLILVTRNIQDFAGFKDVQLENWFMESV